MRWLLKPGFWLMNNPYSAAWDKQLRALMQEHKFENIEFATAKLGPVTVWVANYPYSAFTPWLPVKLQVRPSRATILLAQQKLVEDLLGGN